MGRPKTPELTVDIIIQLIDRESQPIVLIERKYPPFGWALPGGFVDIGETVESAAIREAKEETSLDVSLSVLLGCYSDPTRDPRGHTISLVYVADSVGIPMAADDAKNVQLWEMKALPEALAFDHDRILRDYLYYRQTGKLPSLNIT